MAANPSWNHWKTFIAVIDGGSLSEAARSLGLTQPTAGRQIDALESAVGAPLFTRSKHGIRPTPLALSLLPKARNLASVADELTRAASGNEGEAAGTVRLTASAIVGSLVLPQMLANFHFRHREIAVELSLSNRNENMLLREADVAVRMQRPDQEAIVARRVGKIRVGLYAHRRYEEAHGIPATAQDLFSHSLVGIDRDEHLIAGMSIGGRRLSREIFRLRCDSDVAQLMAVRAGFGIGACHLAIAANEPELRRVLPDDFLVEYDVWVAMHGDLKSSRRVQLLFDHLADAMSDYCRKG